MKSVYVKYLMFFGIGTALFAFLLFLITSYLVAILNPEFFGRSLIYFLAAILESAIITFGIFIFDPLLFRTMALTRRLHRFENLSHPLLAKLSSDAPGTYHHSLNVSNLAYEAAKAIGADSLLVRTAAYYHDIGKLKNPVSFIENKNSKTELKEQNGDKVFEHAKSIISHVQEGVKLAQKYSLPEEIVDLIAQHHGTTLAEYFYNKARELGLKPHKKDFAYNGPDPLSKEAAILMLADAVEAATRSLPEFSELRIKKMVEQIVDEKLADKQLIKSTLNPSEIYLIQKSFQATLLSIHHHRIDYKSS